MTDTLPAAPDYAAEYAASRARVRAMVAGSTPTEAETVVPTCPDWTVRQLVSHVTGICVDLANRNNPGGDTQAWVDRQVAERADRSLGELLDEWDAAAPTFEASIRKVPKAFAGLVYDLVAHEHDLAGALGRPGDRTSSGVTASIELMIPMVQADLKRLGITGTVHLTGDDHTWVVGEGEPTVSIRTSAFELMRLLGSRRSRAQMLAAGWEGDVTPFLDGLVHLPLPERDIVE